MKHVAFGTCYQV